MNGPGKLFTDMIEEKFLRLGAGNLSPTYDELIRAWQDLTRASLKESERFVHRSIDTALVQLGNRTWSCHQKVAAPFYESRREPDDTDWRLLVRCVAGPGRPAVGVHFHVDGESTCWLWLVGRDIAEKKKNGIERAAQGRVNRVSDDRLQPPETIEELSLGMVDGHRKSIKEWRAISKSA